MARHKQAGTCKRLVVAGCLSQRYPKELATEMPEVDQFLGTDEVGSIAEGDRRDDHAPGGHRHARVPLRRRGAAPALAGAAQRVREDRRGLRSPLRVLHHPEAARPAAQPHARIGRARGARSGRRRHARDLPDRAGPDDVRNGSARREADQRDVATPTPGAPRLASLLRALGTVDGLAWIRLHYAYPTACSDELLDVIAAEPRVAKYLDVPIQHVDSGVLKSMRRGYGEKQVRDLVERFRARVPGGTLRTTFIVGHPGETDAAFQRLCDFVREAELDHVGVFNFSREEGTRAALLPKRVPQKEIDARRRELLRIQRQVSKKKLGAMRGRVLRVLVEGASDETEYLSMGRHEGQAPEIDGQVYLSLPPDAATPAPGTFVDARVTHSAEYDLAAELVVSRAL